MTIPEGVTSIRGEAFAGCSALTQIFVPSTVDYIAEGTYSPFVWCWNLSTITVDSENQYYTSQDGVLFNKDMSELIRYPEGKANDTYEIPQSVEVICEAAFRSCKLLKNVLVPESVDQIKNDTFYGCSLDSITFLNPLTRIRTGSSIGYSVESLGTETAMLHGYEVELPEDFIKGVSVQDFAEQFGFAFEAHKFNEGICKICNNEVVITKIKLSEDIESSFNWEDKTLNISGVGDMPEADYDGHWDAFASCIESAIIENGITSIGYNAFRNCKNLKSIFVPESITKIESHAFNGCINLTDIYINSLSAWCGIDFSRPGWYGHPLANNAGNLYINGILLDRIAIPEGIKKINDYAFYNCSNITMVKIPASIESIGEEAFYNCKKLEFIFFYGNVPTVGTSAFRMYDSEQNAEIAIPCAIYYIRSMQGWDSLDWDDELLQFPILSWDGTDPFMDFTDVPENTWYYNAVSFVTASGLFNGTSETTFSPNASMTRAMLVTVLWRYAGEPMDGENSFADVPDGQWYTDAVAWAAQNGIVGGVGNNKFDPNGNITREQMATILYRYASANGIDTSARADLSSFPDGNKVSAYANDAIRWAVAEGLINGSDGKLMPQGNATRAQVATILMRFIENVVG